MDPFLAKMIEAGMAERMGMYHGELNAALGRARDTALHGLKVVEGVVAKELLVSDDVSEMSRINGAVRVPTTLDHPSIPVSNPANVASPK